MPYGCPCCCSYLLTGTVPSADTLIWMSAALANMDNSGAQNRCALVLNLSCLAQKLQAPTKMLRVACIISTHAFGFEHAIGNQQSTRFHRILCYCKGHSHQREHKPLLASSQGVVSARSTSHLLSHSQRLHSLAIIAPGPST